MQPRRPSNPNQSAPAARPTLFTSAAEWAARTSSHGDGPVVFVPTMGALHEGHASLIRQAAAIAQDGRGTVIVSIFVNPTQFNDPADLARYPRTLDADIALCAKAGAHAVYAPSVEDIYPPDAPPAPPLPDAATKPGLEDALRPGHFAGVCQVVKRLFEIIRPASAVFGEKDWQQLCVIRAMTASLRLPISIVPGATIREPDGLAMSSRNRFLSPDERLRAAAISRALREACARENPAQAEQHMRRVVSEAGLDVQYAVVRHADSLMPLPSDSRRGQTPARALIAAKLGAVRLIDNAAW